MSKSGIGVTITPSDTFMMDESSLSIVVKLKRAPGATLRLELKLLKIFIGILN